jgi:hypothetical protein
MNPEVYCSEHNWTGMPHLVCPHCNISLIERMRPLQTEYNKTIIKLNKEMRKTTKTKVTGSKNTTTNSANKSTYTSTTTPNVYKDACGMYRARKCINGVKYSRNFSLLRDAKSWLNSL